MPSSPSIDDVSGSLKQVWSIGERQGRARETQHQVRRRSIRVAPRNDHVDHLVQVLDLQPVVERVAKAMGPVEQRQRRDESTRRRDGWHATAVRSSEVKAIPEERDTGQNRGSASTAPKARTEQHPQKRLDRSLRHSATQGASPQGLRPSPRPGSWTRQSGIPARGCLPRARPSPWGQVEPGDRVSTMKISSRRATAGRRAFPTRPGMPGRRTLPGSPRGRASAGTPRTSPRRCCSTRGG